MSRGHYGQHNIQPIRNYHHVDTTNIRNNGFDALNALRQAVRNDDYAQPSTFVNPWAARSALPAINNYHSNNSNGNSPQRPAETGKAPTAVPSPGFVALPTLPPHKNRDTTDGLEPFKSEIIERAQRGETSKSIAADLFSRGINTNEAALSYRRLKWGVRIRQPGKTTGPLARRSIWLPGGVAGENYESRVRDAIETLGIDPATAELTTPVHSKSQAPGPDGWLYPHRQGAGMVSNLEDFKDEIIERTHRGESCAEIAEALIAKGVQTSDRAVNRRRLLWGLRKRKSRKDLKTLPLDVAKKYVRKKPVAYSRTHPARAHIMRRLELTRMTKAGLSAQEILNQMSARGVVWKRGVSSVLSLQTRWGLISPEENPRHITNKTTQAMKAARMEQRAAFTEIAQELGAENVTEWVETKMQEPASKEARVRLAREKVGPLAPPLKFTEDGKPKRLTAIVSHTRRAKKQQQHQKQGAIEIANGSESEDESSSVSSSGSSSEEEAPPQRTLRSGVVDIAARKAARKAKARDSTSESDSESDDQDVTPREAIPRGLVPPQAIGQGSVSHAVHKGDDDDHAFMMDVDDHSDIDDHAIDAAKSQAEEEEDNDPESAENVAARIFARIGETIPKATEPAPKPIPMYPVRTATAAGGSRNQPQLSRDSHRPSAASSVRKAPATHKSSSPLGLPEDDALRWSDDGGLDAPPSRDSTPASSCLMPQPDKPVPPSTKQVTCRPKTVTLTASAPALIVRPEEAEANKSTLDVVEQYTTAAQMLKDMVQARTENRTLPGSLTGLPPSLKDVDIARRKLKSAAHAMYTAL